MNIVDSIFAQVRKMLPEKAQIGIGVALVSGLGVVSALGTAGIIPPETLQTIMQFQDTIMYIAAGLGVSGGTIMLNEQTVVNRELSRSMNEYARSMNEFTRKLDK